MKWPKVNLQLQGANPKTKRTKGAGAPNSIKKTTETKEGFLKFRFEANERIKSIDKISYSFVTIYYLYFKCSIMIKIKMRM